MKDETLEGSPHPAKGEENVEEVVFCGWLNPELRILCAMREEDGMLDVVGEGKWREEEGGKGSEDAEARAENRRVGKVMVCVALMDLPCRRMKRSL